MKLTEFTPDQRDMEFALLAYTCYMALRSVVDEVHADMAFGITDDHSDMKSVPHPDFLPIENLPLHKKVLNLEQYCKTGDPYDSLDEDLFDLTMLISLTCTSENLAAWEQEARSMDPADLSNERHEFFGVYYRGICETIEATARSRRNIEQDRPLTFAQMAICVDMNERSVMNAAKAGQFRTLQSKSPDGRMLVAAKDAMPWLTQRGFAMLNAGGKHESPSSSADPGTIEAEAVFVPVAADGSMFRPQLRGGSGYTIGAKGEERRVDDYFEALRALQSMNPALWRRPNAAGNWGIVRARTWTRVLRADLSKEAATG